jgi:hypothetical protein
MINNYTYEAIVRYNYIIFLVNWLTPLEARNSHSSVLIIYRSCQKRTNNNIGLAVEKHTILLLLTSSATSLDCLKLVKVLLEIFQDLMTNQKGIKMHCPTISNHYPSGTSSKHVLQGSFSS